MAKIEIEIDIEKKGIMNIIIPNEINPVDVSLILNAVQSSILSGMKNDSKSEIVMPEKKIKL